MDRMHPANPENLVNLLSNTTSEHRPSENRKQQRMHDDLETFFRALADRTRLRLIEMLGDEELCVCDCVQVLKTNQPKVSRHLAYLKRAGLVTARREGKWTYYRLAEPADPYAAKILHELLNRNTAISGRTPNRSGNPITPVPLET